jgi:tetratricopeptide (TPR) repeat protein
MRKNSPFSCLLLAFLLLSGSPQSAAQFRETYFEKGHREIRLGNYAQAIEYLNYTLAEREYFQAYFYRGFAKYQLGDLMGSEADLSACLERIPTHRDALHYRAIVRSELLDYGAALQDFEKAIALDSMNWEIYLNRAITDISLYNFEQAIADCDHALKLNPGNLKSRTIKAVALTELGYPDSALTIFNEILRKHPYNQPALIHRSAALQKLEDYEAAASDLEFILLKDSLNVDALLQLALLEEEKGNNERAMELLNRVLELSPFHGIALFNRGILKSMQEDYRGALADYDRVLSSNPNNVSALYNRALMYEKLGKSEQALADFDQVIELLPNFTQAYLARAEIKQQQHNLSGAQKDLELARYAELQNEQLAREGFSSAQVKKVMEATHLSSRQQSSTAARSEEDYQANLRLKPFFHLIPTHYMQHITDYYLQDKNEITHELIGLLAADHEMDLQAIRRELDSLDRLKGRDSLTYDYYIKRGILHTQNEDYNLAFEDFDRAIALNPNSMLAYFGRANTRLKLKELLLEFNPPDQVLEDGELKPAEGVVVEDENSFENITEDYRQAIAIDSTFSYAYFNLAYVLNQMQEIKQSINTLDRAIALNGEFAEAYFNRGLNYLYLKNTGAGCKDLSKAGELGSREAYSLILRFCRN